MATALQNLNFIVSLTDKMSAPLAKMTKVLDGVKTKFQGGALNVAGGTAGLFGIGYAVDSITEKAIAFESVMADVRKVTNFPTPTGLQDFGNELLKLSHTIPISAAGLAEIATAGGQLGIAEQDLLGFTQIVAKMSTAFDMLPQDAGEAIAKLSNIFHVPITQMELVGDAINTLDNNMAAKSRDIVDVLGRIGGMSQVLGLTTNQASALSTAMLSLGQTPEIAATSINALLLKLGTAGNQSKDFIAALGDIGLSVKQVETSLKANGAQATLDDFLSRLAKLDKAAQLNTLGQLFGAEYADNLAILVGGLDQYRNALGLVNDQSKFQGSMQQEFLIRSQTTANHLKTLQNLWDHLLVNVGTIFLPMVNAGIEKLNNVLDPIISKVSQWSAEYPLLTKVLSYAAVGLVAFAGAVAVASIALGIMGMTAGGLTLVLAILTSPITLAVLAVAALTYAIYAGSQAVQDFLTKAAPIQYMVGKWEMLKGWWAGFKGWLASFDPFAVLLLGAMSTVASVTGAFETLKGWWASFKGWLASLNPFGALLSGINAIITRVQSIGSALKFSAPSLSITPQSGAAPRGDLLNKMSGKASTSSSNTKNVTINVSQNGGSVSPAAIAHHLAMAG